MEQFKKNILVILAVMFLAGYAYAGESAVERDPFNKSYEILKQSAKSRYVVFDAGAQDLFNVPSIEITGLMAVNDNVVATAKIESLGIAVLKQGTVITIKNVRSKKYQSYFIVKKITADTLIIEFEDGREIKGHFQQQSK